MSTLTRRSSGNRVPDYKDYMSFVSAYRNGKKEEENVDGNTFIMPSNNTNHIEPEVSGFSVKACDSYSSFLEKTKNKKFSSVKPPSGPSQSNKEPLKPALKVKTEIFLEINDETATTQQKSHFTTTDEISTASGEESIAQGQVEAKKKMFEGKTQTGTTFRNINNQKTKFNTLKQKLETNIDNTQNNKVTIPPKPIIQRINSFNNVSEIKIEPSQLNPTYSDKTDGFFKEEAQNHLNFHLIEKRNNELQADVSTKERLIGQLNEALKFKSSITMKTEDTKQDIPKENIVIVVSVPEEFSSIPPPPPMPNGFKMVSVVNKTQNKKNQDYSRELDNKSPPFVPIIHSMNEADKDYTLKNGVKSQKSSTLDRTNPLVRKLAYGAMMDMYGAYHDKANSYVSTLPRQHVKKDNGLQKIIDSIAAQGGLEKLSGRSNPKVENE